MAISNKFIHFKTFNKFKQQLDANNISDSSIVFIKDKQMIYTHGTYYNCGDSVLSDDYVKSALTNAELEPVAGDTLQTAISKLHKAVLDNEDVTSTAINRLNTSLGFNEHGEYVPMEGGTLEEVFSTLGEDPTVSLALEAISGSLEHVSDTVAHLEFSLNTAVVKTSLKGVANGVASLGSDGKVPAALLPSYVDDVLEYAALANFPAAGETGKIYVATNTNLTYRWSGSNYVEISQSLALGETSTTAYAGDKGKANADAIAAIRSELAWYEEE